MAATVAVWGLTRARGLRPIAPVVAVTLLAVQLLPLPDWLLTRISPVAAAAWKIALSGPTINWGRITVDPSATTTGLWRLLLAAATILAVSDLARQMSLRKTLAAALAATSIVIWTLGLAFPFDKRLVLLGFIECRGPIEAEFWRTPLVPALVSNGSGVMGWVDVAGLRYGMPSWIAADGFGPYIYANHFAGAMCMTLPVALGLWLSRSAGRVPDVIQHAVVIIIFLAALWTVGVMATSRGGAGALLLAAAVFGSLTLPAGRLRGATRCLAAAVAVALLAMAAAMYGPFSGLEQMLPESMQPRVAAVLADSRVLAGRVATRMFVASPVLGSGLGTYGELFDRFQRGDLLLGYAHNDYAQWLAETGLVGAALMVASVAFLCRRFFTWSRGQGRVVNVLDAGIWAAVAGITAHSAFDWNLHVPANALIACILAGLAVASGDASPLLPRPGQFTKYAGEARWPGLVLTASCLVALVWLTRDAAAETVQRGLREAIVAARLAAADPARNDPTLQLMSAITAGERMSQRDPDNAQLAILIGQANLHLAAQHQAIDDANALLETAESWFGKARRNCAASRGRPEPLAAQKPR